MYYGSTVQRISADHLVRGAIMAVEAKTAQDLEQERKQLEADNTNKTRSGVSTRVMVGRTRGKGSVVVSWEAFDRAIPESLPKDLQEFVNFTNSKESDVLDYAIDGYNQAMQTAASDPIAEFVNPQWSDEMQNQFRIVVRQYSRGVKVPIETAVSLIKPGFDAQFSADAAKK